MKHLWLVQLRFRGQLWLQVPYSPLWIITRSQLFHGSSLGFKSSDQRNQHFCLIQGSPNDPGLCISWCTYGCFLINTCEMRFPTLSILLSMSFSGKGRIGPQSLVIIQYSIFNSDCFLPELPQIDTGTHTKTIFLSLLIWFQFIDYLPRYWIWLLISCKVDIANTRFAVCLNANAGLPLYKHVWTVSCMHWETYLKNKCTFKYISNLSEKCSFRNTSHFMTSSTNI